MDDGKIEEAVLPGGRTGRRSAREGWLFKSVRQKRTEKRTGLKTRHYTRKKKKEAGLKSWPYITIIKSRSFVSLRMTTFGVLIADDCCSVAW